MLSLLLRLTLSSEELIKTKMYMKEFKIPKEEIKQLLEGQGACLATDKITVEGLQVGFMYREQSEFEHDSGWRFFSNTETQEYVDNIDNSAVYMLNTIANYDPAIIPYLELPVGAELERKEGTDTFEKVSQDLI